ncbi:MAG: DNA primase, partial [Synergistaceae bacterium]|nr:DNA primase [Synergistaceae bacterium]
MKHKAAQIFPYFDKNALDAGRFFFGTQYPQVAFSAGNRNLTAFLDEYHATLSQPPVQTAPPATPAELLTPATNNIKAHNEHLDVIPQGTRNSTLLSYAEKVLTKLGRCDEAKILFSEKSKHCKPPLTQEELSDIWRNAVRHYENEIATSNGYIQPEDFNAPHASDTQSPSLAPEDFSDIGQAKILAREYSDRLRYSDATGFICFNGTHWEESDSQAHGVAQQLIDRQLEDAKTSIKYAISALKNCNALDIVIQHGMQKAHNYLHSPAQQAALVQYKYVREYEKFVNGRRKSSNINAVLECVKPYITINPDKLDAEPFLLNTPGGTVDLRNGTMMAHNPDDLITKITAVSPDNANSQMWRDALDTFFCGDVQLITYVQEIAGLAAIGKVFMEAIIIAYGNGSNGKSTFWNTIARVLGNNSYSGKISAGALTLGYRHSVKAELAELCGKRLVIASELDEGTRLNTAVVKNICSTDNIQAEKKFKQPFNFTPTHSLILYTNHLPKVATNDDGTWRCLILVPFNAKIAASQDRKNYSDFLFENAGGAILSWIIEGAKRIIAHQYILDTPEIVSNAINEYRANNDWFADFLHECCVVASDASEQSSAVYRAYRDYCARNDETARNQRDFYKV